jgi:molybdopterin-containing oxidoreductase family membrane subunit
VPTLLAVFDQPVSIAEAARRLKNRGYTDMEIYAPAAFRELEEIIDEKPSRVRLYTLIGGLTGVVAGYAMTIWMANDWPIMLGGKPFSSIPPYTIIGFELTILFGGLLTALGLFVVGGMPRMRLDPVYDARFSAEDFGVAVRCRDRDVSEIDTLLRSHGAREVTLVES